MKKWLPAYAAYFIGVGSAGALAYWVWSKYGEMSMGEDEHETSVTVVTGNGEAQNGHREATMWTRDRG